MLDLLAYRAHAWAAWHVFAYAFTINLATIVAVVYHGSAIGLGPTELWFAALLAGVAVAGVGYQEVRDAGGFLPSEPSGFHDEER